MDCHTDFLLTFYIKVKINFQIIKISEIKEFFIAIDSGTVYSAEVGV